MRDDGNDERLNGPKVLVFAVLYGLLFWLAIGITARRLVQKGIR